MNLDINIPSLITLVLMGKGISSSDIPEEFSGKVTQSADETDISEFMSAMMTAQKTGNILVMTNLESVAEMIRAINCNLRSNKISVLCNGELELSALEEEIALRTLHTADGRAFLPESVRNYSCLTHAGSRLILNRSPYDDEEALFNVNGEAVGVLLEDSLRYEDITGTADMYFHLLNVTEKASLLLKMLKGRTNDTACFSDILLMKGHKEYNFIILPSEHAQNICNAELELFTGLTRKNTFCEVIQRLAELSLPDVLSEDLNRIVTGFYISHQTALPHHRLIANTMERIIMMEELS